MIRPWPHGLRVVGLTGGIASGKSTVSAMLRELGAEVIDADVLAREAVAPGTEGLRAVAERFGAEILKPDGSLDRERLGARVFSSAEDRAALNALLHPRIQALARERAQTAHTERGARVVFYDAPLIVENGMQGLFDGLVVVSLPREFQLERLMARNALSREAAEARLASQLPLEEKVRHATFIVDNAGTLSQTRAQVERLWEELRG